MKRNLDGILEFKKRTCLKSNYKPNRLNRNPPQTGDVSYLCTVVSPTTGKSENQLAKAKDAKSLGEKICDGIKRTYGKRELLITPTNLAEKEVLDCDNYLGQATLKHEPLSPHEYVLATQHIMLYNLDFFLIQ